MNAGAHEARLLLSDSWPYRDFTRFCHGINLNCNSAALVCRHPDIRARTLL
jgi:hypothetical protein